jgi:hypothetical protein
MVEIMVKVEHCCMSSPFINASVCSLTIDCDPFIDIDVFRWSNDCLETPFDECSLDKRLT